MDDKKKFTHRTLEERLAEIDHSINYHKERIAALEAKRQKTIDDASKPKNQKKKQFRRLVLDGAVSADLLQERFGISAEDFEQFLNEVRDTSKEP